MVATLEGLDGDDLIPLYKKISGGVDNEFYNIVRERLGSISGNHRIIGHWGFEGSIPFNQEPWKSQLAKYPKNEIINLWRTYVNSLVNETVKVTGLPTQQAKGLTGLIYNIHLLGDWVPGNQKTAEVLKVDLIVKDIGKNLNRLFGNNSKFVGIITTEISSLDKSLSSPDKADKILQILYRNRIGKKFFDTYERFLSKKGIGYSEKVANKILEKAIYASQQSQRMVHPLKKFMHGTRTYYTRKITQGTKIVNGVLQEIKINGKPVFVLSIPAVEASVGVGVMTFVFTEGVTVYKFANGNITEEEFLKESVKNCGHAFLAGTATYVAVALGATPMGFVVIGVSIGTAIVVDVVWTNLSKEFSTPTITMDDVLGHLPTSLQNRKTVWSHKGYDSILDENRKRASILEIETRRDSILEPTKNKNSIIEYESNRKIIFN